MIALYLFAFVGLAPAGGLLAGWLADIGGTSLAFAVAGATCVVTVGVASASRARVARQPAGVAMAAGS
jgi:hypothetical protein